MKDHPRFRTPERHPLAIIEFAAIPPNTGVAVLADILREHLAEQPGALVLDVSALDPSHSPTETVRVLHEAVQAVRACGAVPVVVQSPDPAFADAARRAGLPDVIADRDRVLQVAAEYPVPPRRTLTDLPPDPHVLRIVRRVVAEFCEECSVGETTSSAQLVASELLSNSIEHTGTSADVLLALRDGQLHLVVRDGSPALPQRRADATPGDPRGRGLVLIDELAVAWAAVRTAAGKLVWAILPIEHGAHCRTGLASSPA